MRQMRAAADNDTGPFEQDHENVEQNGMDVVNVVPETPPIATPAGAHGNA
eukprot:m.1233040 g.1233040  ORF g.1233040 m.1233040 type:complete len:50 (-) comp24661_c2_seq35:158-307(-)